MKTNAVKLLYSYIYERRERNFLFVILSYPKIIKTDKLSQLHKNIFM